MEMKTSTFRLTRGITWRGRQLAEGTPIEITHPALITPDHAMSIIRNGHAALGAPIPRLVTAETGDETEPVEPESGGESPDRTSSPENGPEGGGERSTEINASKAARELAEAAGIDLSMVEGTGNNGQIQKPDVQAAIEARGRAPSGQGEHPSGEPGPDDGSDSRPEGGSSEQVVDEGGGEPPGGE